MHISLHSMFVFYVWPCLLGPLASKAKKVLNFTGLLPAAAFRAPPLSFKPPPCGALCGAAAHIKTTATIYATLTTGCAITCKLATMP